MSRREIRRMLTQSGKGHWAGKAHWTEKRWLLPAAMAVVLLLGLGAGIGVGLSLVRDGAETKDQKHWEQAEMAVDRPQLRAELPLLVPAPALAPENQAAAAEPSSEPVVAVPEPRPGGASDDGAGPREADDAPDTLPVQSASLPVQQASVPLIVPQPPVQPGTPAWIKYAVPPPKAAGRPIIAVVIDDLGVDRKRSEKVIPLRAPLTLSWMTYAEDLPKLTRESRQHGHELMLHVPMQPLSGSWNPGPDVLEVGVSVEENRRRLLWGLQRFEGFVGINNHMGSRFTGDRDGMRMVMEELKKKGLMFLDSVTTSKSVAPELARAYGVPFAERQVFIDNEQTVPAVMGQLAKAEAYARKHGAAIVIGHPHDSTIEALRQWLPGLDAKGIVLVPVSAIVKAGERG